jgi:hypothetical protein
MGADQSGGIDRLNRAGGGPAARGGLYGPWTLVNLHHTVGKARRHMMWKKFFYKQLWD